MFDNLVQSTIFPPILEVLRAAERAVGETRARLNTMRSSPDPLAALIAAEEIAALDCWEPALISIMQSLDTSHQAVHGTPLPHVPVAGHGH